MMGKILIFAMLSAFALAANAAELASQVRETEKAFAGTMADRDWAAFNRTTRAYRA